MLDKLQRMIRRANSHISSDYGLICKREIYRAMYERYAYESTQCGVSQKQEADEEVIVSLTSYGNRLYTVHLTIESLLCQTKKPQRVILWLAENEFTDDDIPFVLKQQQKRGLEIRFCTDYRSYKKLIPTLMFYPDSTIVTVDDDVIYPRTMIEEMYKTHLRFPNCAVFNYGKDITKDNNGNILPYVQWKDIADSSPQMTHLGIGVGGILYPPHLMHRDVTNAECFMKIAPSTDDLWFKAMQLLNGVYAVKNSFAINVSNDKDFLNLFITTEDSQPEKLGNKNVIEHGNDKQLKAIMEHYGIIIP